MDFQLARTQHYVSVCRQTGWGAGEGMDGEEVRVTCGHHRSDCNHADYYVDYIITLIIRWTTLMLTKQVRWKSTNV